MNKINDLIKFAFFYYLSLFLFMGCGANQNVGNAQRGKEQNYNSQRQISNKIEDGTNNPKFNSLQGIINFSNTATQIYTNFYSNSHKESEERSDLNKEVIPQKGTLEYKVYSAGIYVYNQLEQISKINLTNLSKARDGKTGVIYFEPSLKVRDDNSDNSGIIEGGDGVYISYDQGFIDIGSINYNKKNIAFDFRITLDGKRHIISIINDGFLIQYDTSKIRENIFPKKVFKLNANGDYEFISQTNTQRKDPSKYYRYLTPLYTNYSAITTNPSSILIKQ